MVQLVQFLLDPQEFAQFLAFQHAIFLGLGDLLRGYAPYLFSQ